MSAPGSDKPQILLITRNLPPLIGGMERLLLHMIEGLAQYAQLTVIGPRGCSAHLPDQVTVYETSARLALFLPASTLLAIRACRGRRFDIVIGGSGLIALTLRILARLFGLRTLVYLHGLDLVVDSFIYQTLFTPALRKVDRIITNSQNTHNIAVAKGLSPDRIAVVNPGTNLPELPEAASVEQFRLERGGGFGKTMIFVGRMTARKGLARFIQRSLPEILACEPDAGLVIVGRNPEDSLNQLGEEKAVMAAVSELGHPDRVVFLGHLSDEELELAYACADVLIFPLIEIPGDVEGFGMVAIEAAALGTPTVAFAAGGVEDAVSSANGAIVPAGDYDSYTRAVLQILRQDRIGHDACIQFAQGYSWDNFNSKIRAILRY